MAYQNELKDRKALPPYVPAKTFLTFLDHLHAIGPLPSHIDKDVMRHMSGGMQSWLKASLRYMKLVNADDEPTPMLEQLVQAQGEARKALLRELFTETYSFLNGKVDLQNTTPQKLRTAIVELGATGETVEKIVAFLIGLAKEAGIQLSPYLTKRAASQRRPRQRAARKEQVAAVNNPDAQETEERESSAMKVVKLPNAKGTLTLSGSFNPFDLTGDERELVYAIIDKMNAFAQKQTVTEATDDD